MALAGVAGVALESAAAAGLTARPATIAAVETPAHGATEPPVAPRVLLDSVGPLMWNAAVDGERGFGGFVPHWPAVRVLSPLGTESLFVFPARAANPLVLASWARGDREGHAVRIFPRYRWIVIETADSARFFAANGAMLAGTTTRDATIPLGRNFVLVVTQSADLDSAPRIGVRRLPEGDERSSWVGVAGWGAASPLENFLAANTVGPLDPATGMRRDELRLLDLEGRVLWTRDVPADQREYAVSNFGDVAIAREKLLRVFDRSGVEKLRVPLPRNVVGKTAISLDGRFVLASARAPLHRAAGGDLWLGLYDTTKKAPLWTRRDLGGKSGADVIELSVSNDGRRALLRLSSGPVLLLGRDGATLAQWNLDRVSRGEYDPGVAPRRSWLSADGSLVALTTPVARSLAEARGWLYRIPPAR
ncbi:MAG: hypothetical protein HY568_03045 [Candidatus Latescibacteria bacterium]|nr:hypothetical protein [Candidatus Latescibacterota bacterium]